MPQDGRRMRHNLGRCALTSLKVKEDWTKIEKAIKLGHIKVVISGRAEGRAPK
jgi:hypothetical protein